MSAGPGAGLRTAQAHSPSLANTSAASAQSLSPRPEMLTTMARQLTEPYARAKMLLINII